MSKDALTGRVIAQHEAALRVVKEFEEEGRPFVLYLRKFGVEVMHGPSDGQRMFTEYYLKGSLPKDVNVITVQAQGDVTSRHLLTSANLLIPALILEDERWKEAVAWLIRAADLIVSECLLLSDGVMYELETCHGLGKVDQTILILPPPETYLATIDDEEIIQLFPRCVWANEFHTHGLFDTFVAADLLERLNKISQLERDARLTLKDPIKRLESFPITYDGVVKGYFSDAFRLELANEMGGKPETEEMWHYKFWSYFRASSILGLKAVRLSLERGDLYDLIDCYLKLGFLMLRADREGDSVILFGDLEFAAQCATSAYSLSAKYEVGPYLSLAESLWKRIQEVEAVLKSGKLKVEHRPRVKGLVTRRGDASEFAPAGE